MSKTKFILNCPHCHSWATYDIAAYVDVLETAGEIDTEARCYKCQQVYDVQIEMIPTYRVKVVQPQHH